MQDTQTYLYLAASSSASQDLPHPVLGIIEVNVSIQVKVKVKSLSRVPLFAVPWTVAHQASPFMGFSRQEYWSGLPFPSPVDLPDPGIKHGFPALQADALPSEPPVKPQTTVRV